MYNHYRSQIEQDDKVGKKRYILLGMVVIFISALTFASGFFVGIKFQAKREGLLLKTQNTIPKIEDSTLKSETLTPDQARPGEEVRVQGIQGKAQGTTENSESKTEESKPDTSLNTPKEIEKHKSRDKELTFYQTLMTSKKQTTVGLEPSKDSKPKSKVFSGKIENPNKTYTVQVGAYKEMAVAERVMNKLKTKGYRAYMIDKNIPQQGTIFKVRVGEFSHRDKAEELAKKIKDKEKMTTFVTLK